jgi:uncharacterized protein YcbX
MGEARVDSLWRYPVKSLGGERVASAQVEARGLRHDRRWMLTGEDGVFLTQRADPELTRFAVRASDGGLTLLDTPTGEHLRVGVPPPEAREVEARVWSDALRLRRAAAGAEAWISRHLGKPVWLVYQHDAAIRPLEEAVAEPGEHVSLSDGAPILVVGTASLRELNRRLAERGEAPVPMDRFRANIVVRTQTPFAEDTWERVQIGPVRIRLTHPCKRCAVITTDQQTGERFKEPLRTLATFRKQGSGVMFGMNAVAETLGAIHEGDYVAVISERSARV